MMRRRWTGGFTLLLAAALLLTACGNETDTSKAPDPSGTATAATQDDGIFDPGDNPFGEETLATPGTGSGGSRVTGQKATGSVKPSPTDKAGKTVKPAVTTKSQAVGVKPTEPADYLKTAAGRMPRPKGKVTDTTITILSHATHEVPKVLNAAYPGFKVNCQQVSSDALMSRYVTLVNSDKSPDLFWNDYNPQLIAKQYVQAWDGHIDFNTEMWKGVKESIDNWKVGGKYYYIFPSGGRQNIFLYNRAMFRAKGLAEPAELFKQGKWDWDALADMAKKLTIDENNDGKPEQYGLGLDGGAHAFIFAAGTDLVKFTNGRPKNMLLSAEVTRAMEFYVKLNKENKLYTGSKMIEAFERGEIAILNTQKWVALKEANKKKVESGEYLFTTIPKDPKAAAHYTAEETPGWFLPKGAKNAAGAAAYLIALRYSRYDGDLIAASQKEDEANGKALPQAILDMEALIDQKTKPVQLGWTYLELGPYIGDINTRPLAGESWSKVAAEIAPKIDSAVKTYLTNTSLG